MALSECLYTKDQLQDLMNKWGCTEPIPKKGRQVLICWPYGIRPNTAVITAAGKKSDDGKRLYLVRMGMDYEVFPRDDGPVR